MTTIIHRACAHDSARACFLILSLAAASAFAELICRLTGVGSP